MSTNPQVIQFPAPVPRTYDEYTRRHRNTCPDWETIFRRHVQTVTINANPAEPWARHQRRFQAAVTAAFEEIKALGLLDEDDDTGEAINE